ncbi:MAG: M81 family metallopeptidase [Lysobacterales bacterium]|jgi:microcystin degradation protein MlrC
MRYLLLISLACMALAGCTTETQETTEASQLRVAVAEFSHETCTFCPGGDTTVEDWTRLGPPRKGADLLSSGGYVGGFVSVAGDYRDVELVGLTSPDQVFGGSSRSWNTLETFEHFMGLMLDDLRSAMPVDGVFLALHGAMAVRDLPRPEAEIARRVRAVVGPDVPIAATFDLHGNEDRAFLEQADFAFVTKRYPHYDARLQGERAARALVRTMRGEYVPTTATRKPGVITATVLQWTGQSPSMDIMERARRWEARQKDTYVSVFYGYPWSDVPDVGATVHVMTNDDQALADRIADDMNDYIWRVREAFAVGGYPAPDEAAAMVTAAIEASEVPVAVGDHSDRPGDATHILKAFEAAGIGKVLYGAISSPDALGALQSSGATVGDAFDMQIGGFTPSGGQPVRISGTLSYVGEGLGYPYIAAVDFGAGNTVFLTPAYCQVLYPERFAMGNVEPANYDVFVVKSRVHFRRGFDETGFARTIVIVEPEEPYVGTTRLDALPYEHAKIDKLFPFGRPDDRPKYEEFISAGDTLPIQSVINLDGETVDLAAPGKRKLVVLFATWCKDSNRAMKALNQSGLLADESIEVIAIAREETADIVIPWRDLHGIRVPMAVDPDRAIFKQFAAAGVPRFITVDEDNRVIKMNLAEVEDPLSLIEWR